jgi:serine/threonine protein kinase
MQIVETSDGFIELIFKMAAYSFSDGQFSINGEILTIPKIDLIEILGEGANGVVLKGHHTVLARDVAVKIWLPRHGFKYPNEKRFFAEIGKLGKLNRPHIVKINDAELIGNRYCYAILELVNGITLKEWLRTDRTLDERLFIAKEIFNEMKYVHNQKLFHGDLHDRNILITNDGEIKLLDFGTSIFSHNQDPHEREKHVLLDTTLKLLPEENDYHFLDLDCLLHSPAEFMPLALISLTRMIEAIKDPEINIEDPDLSGYNKQSCIYAFVIQASEAPFFNIERIIEVFREYGFEEILLENFLGTVYTTCEAHINKESRWENRYLKINDENLEKTKDMYVLWRQNFIDRVQNGSLDT